MSKHFPNKHESIPLLRSKAFLPSAAHAQRYTQTGGLLQRNSFLYSASRSVLVLEDAEDNKTEDEGSPQPNEALS